MPRHHTIISGTGRAGTTFLVQLLTELGLDTGFSHAHAQMYRNANAGMEHDIRNREKAPYIIKSPGLCDYLDEALQGDEIIIDYAIIPMRDLYSAAQSRREVARKADPTLDIVPGGLWPRMKIEKQAANQEWILAAKLYNLTYTLAKHDIPIVLLLFPRFVNDPEYLYRKLKFLLRDISYDTFLRAFQVISRPELVHDFSKQNNQKDDPKHSLFMEKSVVNDQAKQFQEREQREQELRAQLSQKEQELKQLSQKEQALQEVFNSKAWKFVIALRKVRSWFLP
jgi:hypothetical protein